MVVGDIFQRRPGFGQCGGSFFELISISGNIIAVNHFKHQLRCAAFRERLHQIMESYIAGCQRLVAGMDRIHKVCKHFFHIRFIGNSHAIGHRHGCLATGGIDLGFRVEKHCIESPADIIRPFLQAFLFGFIEQLSHFCHQFHIIEIGGGCRQCNGRELGNTRLARPQIKPVAKTMIEYVAFRFTFQVVHIAVHHVPGIINDFLIAIPFIQKIGKNHRSAPPFGGIAESPEKFHIFGCDVGNKSVTSLGIHHVINQFPVQRIDIIPKVNPLSHQVRLFQPA